MTTQKVFVIFYQPGYGDDPYIKGAFSSRKKARAALKADVIYKRSKEGLDFEIEELDLDKLC